MITPKPPPEQMAPEISRLSYPYFSMEGMAMRPMAMTDAPATPVHAAKRMAIPMVAMRSPPRIGPKRSRSPR